MRPFLLFLTEAPSQVVLYHVTLTKTVPKIISKGILPLQSSNWVQAASGQRYGGGYIFAFTNKLDAMRWAANWDWQTNTQMGSGKISIVEFNGVLSEWEVDTADPLSQASNEGKWLKRQKFVPAAAIRHHFPVTPAEIKQLVRR